VRALAEFRRCGFADATFGAAIHSTIRVKQPETEQLVSAARLRSWLYSGGKSPNEQALKSRLRGML